MTTFPPTVGFEMEFRKVLHEESRLVRFGTGDVADLMRIALGEVGFRNKKVELIERNDCWTSKWDCGQHEITTPVLRTAIGNIERLGKFVRALDQLFERSGLRKDRIVHVGAGFHVHVGVGEQTSRARRANVVKTVWNYDQALIHLAGPVRAGFSVRRSVPLGLEDMRRRVSTYQNGDYEGRIHTHGGLIMFRDGKPTMEFRYAHFSFDPDFVFHWIMLVICLTAISMSLPPIELTDEVLDVSDLVRFLDQNRGLLPRSYTVRVDGLIDWVNRRDAEITPRWRTEHVETYNGNSVRI